jgi:heavy metal sensor kinase
LASKIPIPARLRDDPPQRGASPAAARHSLSIGTRWALRYSVATTALIGILTFHLYRQIESLILGAAEAELERHAVAVTEAITRLPYDPVALGSFLEVQIAGVNADLRLAIDLWNDAGELVVARDILAPFDTAPPGWQPQNPGELLHYSIDRAEPYPTLALLTRNGRGITRVAIYGETYLEHAAEVRNTFLYASTLAIFATGAAGSWLARQSLRPIAAIAATARRISASPSDEAIPVRGTGDELDGLATTLNDMLGRIRSSMNRIREFSTDAAHELRTPLSVVRTRIEVTLEIERSPDEYRRVLEECLNDVTLLADGVHSVLRLASSEAGLTAATLERIDLPELVASVVEFFEPIAEESQIQLQLVRGAPVEISGDRVWLARLFSNLVDNALKYSEAGGSVRLAIEGQAEDVVVSVADTGVGIPAAMQGRVFERFYRGELPRGSGLGIGLPLAQEIARAHGGMIEVESTPGGGSRFRVRLPRELRSGTRAA